MQISHDKLESVPSPFIKKAFFKVTAFFKVYALQIAETQRELCADRLASHARPDNIKDYAKILIKWGR